MKKKVRELRASDKCRLSPRYESFHVDPCKCNTWSVKLQNSHVNKYSQCNTRSFDAYQKLVLAGLKKAPKKRRAGEPVADLFVDK